MMLLDSQVTGEWMTWHDRDGTRFDICPAGPRKDLARIAGKAILQLQGKGRANAG